MKFFRSGFRREINLQRMNTAVKLNTVIKEKSQDSKLIMLNLPSPPRSSHEEEHCILSSFSTQLMVSSSKYLAFSKECFQWMNSGAMLIFLFLKKSFFLGGGGGGGSG